MNKIKILLILAITAALALPACRPDAPPAEADHAETESGHVPAGTVVLSAEAVTDGGIAEAQAKTAVLTGKITVLGELAFNARRLAEVSARTDGRIERVMAAAGDRVGAGQILAEIYSREFLAVQAEVLQAGSRAARLRGDPEESAALAFLQAARRKLLPLGWEDKDIDALIAAGEPRPFLSVRAPFAGTIIEAPALPGAHVTLGTPFFKMADPSSLWARIHIFEKDLALVRSGSAAVLRTPAFPGREFSGRLVLIGPVMDEETRTVEGRVEVANLDGSLRTGMYIEADIPSGAERTAVVVPASALQEFRSQPVVFVRTKPGTFVLRPVETGARQTGEIEIIRGLSASEWVVTSGGFLLKSELLKSTLADEHGHD